MDNSDTYILWEDETFTISTPVNPHIPYSEGLHVIVAPIHTVASSWEDPELSAKAFGLASEVCRVADDLKLSPWFNIQANGNWGLLSEATPFFHIHIYGRNKTKSWGRPIILPELPDTYSN